MPLTSEQQSVADRLVKGAITNRDRVQVLRGTGGSGKSFVTKEVAVRLEKMHWRTLFTTLSHSALKACPSEYPGLVVAALCGRCKRLVHSRKTVEERKVANWFGSARRILVIDEAFLLTSAMLENLFSKLQAGTSVPRGGVRVILVGDPGQCKPIGGKPITAHPDFQRALVSTLTSGTMRMTPAWAREVHAFGENVGLADASLFRHRAEVPPEGAMILTQTRADALAATRAFLCNDASFTVLPIIPKEDDELGASEENPSERKKAAEPLMCTPGQPMRLVFNVRTESGSRVTDGGTALNNGTQVWFAGIVDKDGDTVFVSPGTDFQLQKSHRIKIGVTGESESTILAPFVSAGVTVAPLRAWWVKTICAAQGETIDGGGVYLYADGPVRQSNYCTAAGRVRSADKFFVSPSVARVEPD
jgi:hypothetical protein